MSGSAARAASVWDVCALLGVPERDRNSLVRLVFGQHGDALNSYVDVMVADRCSRPTDDLLSGLIATGVDGMDLTADEVREAAVAMLTIAARRDAATRRT